MTMVLMSTTATRMRTRTGTATTKTMPGMTTKTTTRMKTKTRTTTAGRRQGDDENVAWTQNDGYEDNNNGEAMEDGRRRKRWRRHHFLFYRLPVSYKWYVAYPGSKRLKNERSGGPGPFWPVWCACQVGLAGLWFGPSGLARGKRVGRLFTGRGSFEVLSGWVDEVVPR